MADSGLDGDQRPDIEGVALQQPGQQPEDFEDNSTTNLDPLAVNDDPWSDSDLNPSSKPGINGVALTELSETTLDKDETIPGNELDPLAVTDQTLADSGWMVTSVQT